MPGFLPCRWTERLYPILRASGSISMSTICLAGPARLHMVRTAVDFRSPVAGKSAFRGRAKIRRTSRLLLLSIINTAPASLPIATSGKRRLFRRRRMKQKLLWIHSIAEESSRWASMSVIGWIVPESRFSIRRKISASYTASTEGSHASSKPSSGELASTARSSTESVKALFRSSVVSLLTSRM
jgi:hypothetical protein